MSVHQNSQIFFFGLSIDSNQLCSNRASEAIFLGMVDQSVGIILDRFFFRTSPYGMNDHKPRYLSVFDTTKSEAVLQWCFFFRTSIYKCLFHGTSIYKWMISGYHHFRKPPYNIIGDSCKMYQNTVILATWMCF